MESEVCVAPIPYQVERNGNFLSGHIPFCINYVDPPTNPSAPIGASVTMVTTHTLTLVWTQPNFSGNLPLTGYLVEVLLLGNPLCPQSEPEWSVHQTVANSSALQTTVSGLIPYQQYRVRIRATNSAYQSVPSVVAESFWTKSDSQCLSSLSFSHSPESSSLPPAPSAPPSNVEVVSGNQLLIVSWQVNSPSLSLSPPPQVSLYSPASC